ncbi:MAG: acetate--CoA ligase family protein, partial [Burkholderiaceae bacterium]
MISRRDGLHRLFSPRSIAVFGGAAAAEVVRQCRQLGFDGDIWPVHPSRDTLEGLRCYAGVDALPAAPDASFIAVPREGTVGIVSELALRGAGGAVCYASGFAEAGDDGRALQQRLVQMAGDMPLLGPNCYGMLNYLDGVALWPDQHGGRRVQRGVAIVTQSGNVGLNLTMQRRGLPLAFMITLGNQAGASMETIVAALLQDSRVTAIGLHVEGLADVPAFARVALQALQQGVPLVALKSGSSRLGAQTAMSHTSSLAGPDALYDALFARCGIARVFDPEGLIETLKLLHVHGALRGRRIATASCSGGEASLVADLAQPRDLHLPELPAPVRTTLQQVLGDKVTVANPLDYHTYIWGHLEAQTACFTGLLHSAFDMHLLLLDFPRADRCDGASWQTTLNAFLAAQRETGAAACVVASMPEGLDEDLALSLLARGIAPMHGLAQCLDAIANAALIGVAQARAACTLPLELLKPLTAQGPQEVQRTPQSPESPELPELKDLRELRNPLESLESQQPQFSQKTLKPLVAEEVASSTTSERPRSSAAPASGLLDEFASKRALAAFGVPVPDGALVGSAQVLAYAEQLGYPVVLKAVGPALAHKTEAGAVRLNLRDAAQVRAAWEAMADLSDRFLVERMAGEVVAEFIVGVQRDAQFGLALTLGAGGIFVELMQDAVTLLLPVSRDDVHVALRRLKCWPLVCGYRGRAPGDVDALLDAVMAV